MIRIVWRSMMALLHKHVIKISLLFSLEKIFYFTAIKLLDDEHRFSVTLYYDMVHGTPAYFDWFLVKESFYSYFWFWSRALGCQWYGAIINFDKMCKDWKCEHANRLDNRSIEKKLVEVVWMIDNRRMKNVLIFRRWTIQKAHASIHCMVEYFEIEVKMVVLKHTTSIFIQNWGKKLNEGWFLQ